MELVSARLGSSAVRWNSYTLTSGSNCTTGWGRVLALGLGWRFDAVTAAVAVEMVLALFLSSEPEPEYSATRRRHDLRTLTRWSVDEVLRT